MYVYPCNIKLLVHHFSLTSSS